MTCRLSSVVLPFLELSARHSVKVLGCTGRKWDQGCSVGRLDWGRELPDEKQEVLRVVVSPLLTCPIVRALRITPGL